MFGLAYGVLSYGLVLQGIAIFHFIRRRPEGYWLWIIILGGGLGALVYIVAEVVPDLGALSGELRIFGHRKRIKQLEALVLCNPSEGNYWELADLLLEQGNFVRAKGCYDQAISARTDHIDPFYRRAVCNIEMKDFPAALPDLRRVLDSDSKYDRHRALGLEAYALAQTGEIAQALDHFARATERSTLSETQYNYACLLAQLPQFALWDGRFSGWVAS